MNLKKNIKLVIRKMRRELRLPLDKTGSYITEAAMSLPVLILCIVALALIIRIIAICENIGFVTAAEIKDIDIAAYIADKNYGLAQAAVEDSVLESNPKLTDFEVSSFRYLYSENEIEDLIGIRTKANFTVENPIGIYGEITFTQGLLTRGFTGRELNAEPLSADEFMSDEAACEVVVFPKYGMRYHTETCRYVRNDNTETDYKIKMQKEDAKAKGYTPCLVCKGGEK